MNSIDTNVSIAGQAEALYLINLLLPDLARACLGQVFAYIGSKQW